MLTNSRQLRPRAILMHLAVLAALCTPTIAQTTKPNRLAAEKSPYLLQHAHNPVDWYPWGDEAFAAARKLNRPIFLSIGYSTCHWCHVMERESFSDPDIAKLLNDNFIAIKVDREERPDVDRIYMAFVQASTGGGGWPLTVFLTPDGRPFLGGTYFPPEDANGLPGMKTVVPRVAELWRSQPDKITERADKLMTAIRDALALAPDKAALRKDVLDLAYSQARASFDKVNGGFAQAPKFPEPALCSFLLRCHARNNEPEALSMVAATLRAMAGGGIHDQLGGGFHRYSTDARWFCPHFEKMLYDQAQLAVACMDAYQATGDSLFADVARSTLDYVLRELTGPEGQFYCAQDADSAPDANKPDDRVEGAFYVWTAEQIRTSLGDGAAIVIYHYGVKDGGNVDNDPLGHFKGKNILYAAHTVEETAAQFKKTPADIARLLADSRSTLLEQRLARSRPRLDLTRHLLRGTAWRSPHSHAADRSSTSRATPRQPSARPSLFEHASTIRSREASRGAIATARPPSARFWMTMPATHRA